MKLTRPAQPLTRPAQPFHVLRIGYTEQTTVEAVRGGEVIVARDHNEAADLWAAGQERHSRLSESDHFELVVMNAQGQHVVLDVTTKLCAVMKLSNVQGLS